MKVKEALSRIRFNTNTVDDLSSKSVNNLLTNKAIIQQLMFSLDRYASYTKAIEAIHSLPLETTTQYITKPDLVLRSEGYKFVVVWLSGIQYPIDFVNLSKLNSEFTTQSITGIPRWIVPFENLLNFQPTVSSSYNSTTLAAAITATDTTITLTDASTFLDFCGRITIGTEKIFYQYKSGNTLYNCIRGKEYTTAAAHEQLETVKENNLHIFYLKLHYRISVTDEDWVPETVQEQELEICEEHAEMIIDYASYKLLLKLDSERADAYKMNYDDWLKRAKIDINQGRQAIKKSGYISNPYYWQQPTTYPYL